MEGMIGMIKMVLAVNETAEWKPCDGRLLGTQEYPEAFALMGYRFGGEGGQFALPVIPPVNGAHYVIKVRTAATEPPFQGLVAQMVLWVGDDIPADWAECDGRLIEGADFPILQRVAAAGNSGPMAQFHLPKLEAQPGIKYIICMHGADPMAAGGPGAPANDDDY